MTTPHGYGCGTAFRDVLKHTQLLHFTVVLQKIKAQQIEVYFKNFRRIEEFALAAAKACGEPAGQIASRELEVARPRWTLSRAHKIFFIHAKTTSGATSFSSNHSSPSSARGNVVCICIKPALCKT